MSRTNASIDPLAARSPTCLADRIAELSDSKMRAAAICSHLAELTSASRVSLIAVVDNAAQWLGSSAKVTVDTRSSQVRFLGELSETTQESCFIHRGDDAGKLQAAHSYFSLSDCERLWLIPIASQRYAKIRWVVIGEDHHSEPEDLSDDAVKECVAAYSSEMTPWLDSADPPSQARQTFWHKTSKIQKSLGLLALLIAAVLVWFIPIPLVVSVVGVAEPAVASRVFSPLSGNIAELLVEDGQSVSKSQPLLRLQNEELLRQFESLQGDLAVAIAEQSALQTGRIDQFASGPQSQIPGLDRRARSGILRKRIASLKKQLELSRSVVDSLTIAAPRDGKIVMRHAKGELIGREIIQGQWLMDVIDSAAGIRAVFQLADDQLNELSIRLLDDKNPIDVSIRSNTTPDVSWQSKIADIGNTAQRNEVGDAYIPLTAYVAAGQEMAFGSERLPIGVSLTGRIDLGRRPLGEILCQPVIRRYRKGI